MPFCRHGHEDSGGEVNSAAAYGLSAPSHPSLSSKGKKGERGSAAWHHGDRDDQKNLGASESLRGPTVIGAALHATSADFTGPTDSLASPYQESTRASSPMGQAGAILKVRYQSAAIAKGVHST